jgi:hypothetical protein
MKRPTHIFVRLYYPTYGAPVISALSFAEHPTLLKWISKYGTDRISFPRVPFDSLSDALPSFWGEMRRYAFCSIADYFKAFWDPPLSDEAEPVPEEAEPDPEEAEPVPDEAEPDPEEAELAPEEAELAPEEAKPDPEEADPDPFAIEELLRGQSVVFYPQVLEVEWVDPEEMDDDPDASVTGLYMEFKDLLAMIRILKPDEKDRHAYFDRKIKYHMAWRRRMPSKLVCHFDNARDNEDDEIDSSYLDNC